MKWAVYFIWVTSMAITVTSDQTLVNATGGDAEAITNWTTTAAWSGVPAVSNDVYIQGSNAINARASSGTPGTVAIYWDHLTTGTANLDLTTSSHHVFFWIKCFSLPSMEKRVRGGLGVSISSTAGVTKVGTDPWSGITDSKTWFVSGSDYDPTSGWVCYVVDPASTADFSTGTPVMTSVDRIGIRAAALQTVGGGSVKPFPVIWDALRYGTKLTITGSTGTFEDIYVADSTTANQYGIITKTSGIYFGAGKLVFGTTGQAAVCTFTDTKQTLVWQDFPVAATFYELSFAGAGSFATTFTLGTYSGGVSSAGCTIRGSGQASQRLITPVIVSGGTTYVAADILTVSGGTFTEAAQFKVITVSSGVITEIRMERAGKYSVVPTGTLAVTDARNNSATFTATRAGGSIWTLSASAANQTVNIYGSSLSEMRTGALTTTTTIRGTTFDNFGNITTSGATIDSCVFQNLATAAPISATYGLDITVAGTVTNNRFINCATAVKWNVNADTSTRLDGCSFTSGGTGHGIELGTSCPTSLTFDDISFTGYGGTSGSNPTASSGSTDAAVYNNSGKTVTITITGTGNSPSVRNGAGSTTVIVAGAVTASLTVKTIANVAIQDARVLILADTGGPFPYNVTVTISNSGATATVTHTSHGLETNDKVQIKSASLAANNGVWTITYINANSYSYTMGSSPGSSPTGTIKATFAVLSGLTDVNGLITMSRVFGSAQPITGRVRKSTSAPLYKTTDISGSVSSSAGYSATVQLLPDE